MHDLRRQAHSLAGRDAVGGFDALAVEADLAGAQQLLQPSVIERRIVPLEPAVDPDAVFLMCNTGGFGHVRVRTR